MTTNIDCAPQGKHLQNANTGPCFCQPAAAVLDRVAISHGDPGVPNENHMQVRLWGLRRITEDCDAIDEAALVHGELTAAASDLYALHAFDEETCQVADKINTAAKSLSDALDAAVAAAKAEVQALWRGPAVCRVDSALLAHLADVLPKWFPAGAFDASGAFACAQDDMTIQISPSGVWIVSYQKTVNRCGTGLSLLWSIVCDEPHSVTVARLAQGPLVAKHMASGAAS